MTEYSKDLQSLQDCCHQICARILSEIQQNGEQDATLSSIKASTDHNLNYTAPQDKLNTKDSIHDCGKPLLILLSRQAQILFRKQGDLSLLQQRLSDLIGIANDKFYAYPFAEVPTAWRRLYTDASILQACAHALRSVWTGQVDAALETGFGARDIEEMVRGLDMAIIMAGAAGIGRRAMMEEMMGLLGPLCSEDAEKETETGSDGDEAPRKRRRISRDDDAFSTVQKFTPTLRNPIPRRGPLSLAAFEKHMLQPADPDLGPEPLIFTDALTHWPAFSMRPWKKPSYLLSRTLGGRRLIPVEVGRSYVDEGWGQRIVAMRDFIKEYLPRGGSPKDTSLESTLTSIPSDTTVATREEEHTDAAVVDKAQTGYLAQHDLFAQIPALRNDICIPDYCYSDAPPPHFSSPLAAQHAAQPTLDSPLLNAWFGPAGTISPLHVDPYHNVLTQVVGSKYVRLYAPRCSAGLHARGVEDGGVNMQNTSEVDVGVLEGWDGGAEEWGRERERFPGVEELPFVECVLTEGEALYIPVGWWHYVRSLSVSFSVSFWWN